MKIDEDFKTNPDPKHNLEIGNAESLKTEDAGKEPENKAATADKNSMLNGLGKIAETPKQEKKKVKYLEKFKEEIWKNILE